MNKSQNFDREKAEKIYNDIAKDLNPALLSNPMFKIEFMKACEQAALITGVDIYEVSISPSGKEIEVAYGGNNFLNGHNTVFKTTITSHNYNHEGTWENYITRELYISDCQLNKEVNNNINPIPYDVYFYIKTYNAKGICMAEQECLLKDNPVWYGPPGHQTIQLNKPHFSMTNPPQPRFENDKLNYIQKYRMPNNSGLIVVQENNQQYYYMSEIQGYDAWGYSPNEKYGKDSEGNMYRLDGQPSQYNGISFEEFAKEATRQFNSQIEKNYSHKEESNEMTR